MNYSNGRSYQDQKQPNSRRYEDPVPMQSNDAYSTVAPLDYITPVSADSTRVYETINEGYSMAKPSTDEDLDGYGYVQCQRTDT